MVEECDFWVLSERVLRGRAGAMSQEESLAILVQGRKVAEILPAKELRSGPAREAAEARKLPIYDLGDSPIVPSFVNAHTHLALSPLRGITSAASRAGNVVSDVFFQLEKHLRPGDVRAFTKIGAFESILCGVGEVWDHYYFGEEVAEALAEVSLPGVVAPTLQDLGGPGKESWEAQLAATERISSSVTFRDLGVRAALGPHASDTVSHSLFEKIGELARRWELPVHLHLSQSIEEKRAELNSFPRGSVEDISRLLEKTEVLMAHGLYLNRRECELLTQADWTLVYCPFSQLQFGILSPLAAWLESGGRWAVGTDCVASNDALDVQRELPLIGGNAALGASFSSQRSDLLRSGGGARAEAVESVRKELLSATSLVAPEVLLAGAWGHGLPGARHRSASGLQLGGLASFLVLHVDHPTLFPGFDLPRSLAYGSTIGAIDWAMIGGRVWGRESSLQEEVLSSPEYRHSLEEARARYSELLERAGLLAILS